MLHELHVMTNEERMLICANNINKLRYDFDKLFLGQYYDIDLEREMFLKYGDLWTLAKSYNNNYFQKKTRLNKRIKNILDNVNDTNKAYFLTLTFTDEFLAPPFSKELRRRYVQEFCKRYFVDYVANIDYGKKGGREHYHAVVLTNVCAVWSKGFFSYKIIRITNNDKKRLSKYLIKLTNHAMKEYGKAERIIYSRKKRSFND